MDLEQRIIKKAVKALNRQQVIAYPTEAVWGLGCCPHHKEAASKVLALKKRDVAKGLILIGANFEQVVPFLALSEVPQDKLDAVLAIWPGPYTWVFPKSGLAPNWITGNHQTIAVRVTDHPIAKQLCLEFGGPIVSTSANSEGLLPAKTEEKVREYFPSGIEVVVPGDTGNVEKPTEIRHVLTEERLR